MLVPRYLLRRRKRFRESRGNISHSERDRGSPPISKEFGRAPLKNKGSRGHARNVEKEGVTGRRVPRMHPAGREKDSSGSQKMNGSFANDPK